MRIKRSTFKKILRRKLHEMLDAETPADVEAVEDVWAGCPDAGNLELDIDFAKAAGSEPVTDEQEVMLIVQKEVRKYLREMALRKKLVKRHHMNEVWMANPRGAPMPMRSRASDDLQYALRGEGIPDRLLEAMETYIERGVRSGLTESTVLKNLRGEVDEFIHLCQRSKR
jgi:hypothetical protein